MNCGTVKNELVDVTTETFPIALDPSIFTVDETELFIEASEFNQVGLYSIRLFVYYEDYPDIHDSLDFDVQIINPCSIITPSEDLAELEYLVGSGPMIYNIQALANNEFRASN